MRKIAAFCDGGRVGVTSRPRCSEQRIRQRLMHSQTRVAGSCAVAGAARPLASRHVASRRDARVWVKPRERRRTRRTPPPPPRVSLIHSGILRPADVPPPIPSPPLRGRLVRGPRTRSRAAEERKNESDGRREGEVERARE